MGTTPLWVPLVVAGIGLLGAVAGTVAGVLITQRRADRRETLTWERERERERERWAREDAARTFEHRREAYIDFFKSVRKLLSLVLKVEKGEAELRPADWEPMTSASEHLRIYATRPVQAAASLADNRVSTLGWMIQNNHTAADEVRAMYYEAESRLLSAIRTDLGIPTD